MLYRELRPISSKHLNKIINVIINKYNVTVCNTKVLDLFCGIGTFGIYCLQKLRVEYVIFIDKKWKYLEKISTYLTHKDITSFKCIKCDCVKLRLYNIHFNIIMIDPPYAYQLISQMLCIIYKLNICVNNTIIICRKHKKEKIILPQNMYIDYEQYEANSSIIYILMYLRN